MRTRARPPTQTPAAFGQRRDTCTHAQAYACTHAHLHVPLQAAQVCACEPHLEQRAAGARVAQLVRVYLLPAPQAVQNLQHLLL